jgi:hypothetical protein
MNSQDAIKQNPKRTPPVGTKKSLPDIKSQWKIGDKHQHYGKVIAMGIREGEPYRFFKSKDGVISLIPLPCLIEEAKW